LCSKKTTQKIYFVFSFCGFRTPKALIGPDFHMSGNEGQYNYSYHYRGRSVRCDHRRTYPYPSFFTPQWGDGGTIMPPPSYPNFLRRGGAIMSPLLSDLSDEGTALPIHLILKVIRDKTHVSRYRTLKKRLAK
jgi:hypothetical protein